MARTTVAVKVVTASINSVADLATARRTVVGLRLGGTARCPSAGGGGGRMPARRDRRSANVGTPRTRPPSKKTGRLLSRSDNHQNARYEVRFRVSPDMGAQIVPITSDAFDPTRT
jgi:hypothetical protein